MATNVEISQAPFYCRRVATAYALAAPGANTNMLSATTNADATTNLTPSGQATCFRIGVSLATSAVFSIRVTDGSTAYTQALFAGATLTAGQMYTCVFPVSRTSQGGSTTLSYNFQVSIDGVIQTLLVDEVNAGVI